MTMETKQTRIGYEAVLRGMDEAILHMEGKLDLQPDFEQLPEQDARTIRDSLKLSQSQFAGVFGIPLATVKNWEQGRRTPDQTANVLLFLIDQMPKTVAQCLQKKKQHHQG